MTTKYLLYSEDESYGVQRFVCSQIQGLYNTEEEAIKASKEYDKNVGAYWRLEEWKIKRVNLTPRTAYVVSYAWDDEEFGECVGTDYVFLHKENAEKKYSEIKKKEYYMYQSMREIEVFVLAYREEGMLQICFIPCDEHEMFNSSDFYDI